MKNAIIRGLFFCCIALFSVACGSETTNENASNKAEQTERTGKEYTSAYICPMHCEGSGSTKEGDCGVCGMAYVENKKKGHDHSHDGHNHDHDHGHDHDHDGHDHNH